MSARSEAELSLIIRAKNLAQGELGKLEAGLGGIADKAAAVASKLRGAFSVVGNAIGNIASDVLVRGDSIGEAAQAAGLLAAGQMVEGFSGQLLSKLAGSSVVAAAGGVLASIGTAMGGLIAAAIPVGMALLPALLVAALIAAVVFLVNNPQIVNRVLEVAGSIVSTLVGALAGLGGLILGAIVAAPGVIADVVGGFVGDVVGFIASIPGRLAGVGLAIVSAIVGGLVSLPGRIADVIRDAFAGLKIDIGPFHIRSTGVTIDLPEFSGPGAVQYPHGRYTTKGYAEGGWAGLHGPELAWLGERGPEYVVSNQAMRQGGPSPVAGVTLVGVSEREILDMVDRGLYFRLQTAGASTARA